MDYRTIIFETLKRHAWQTLEIPYGEFFYVIENESLAIFRMVSKGFLRGHEKVKVASFKIEDVEINSRGTITAWISEGDETKRYKWVIRTTNFGTKYCYTCDMPRFLNYFRRNGRYYCLKCEQEIFILTY